MLLATRMAQRSCLGKSTAARPIGTEITIQRLRDPIRIALGRSSYSPQWIISGMVMMRPFSIALGNHASRNY
jgi:hypothetical protein